MRANSEVVLLDLLSDELSGHLNKIQRLNAVAAIAELSTGPAEAKLAKIADSQELDPEVRAAALEALVAGRPDRLAHWLDHLELRELVASSPKRALDAPSARFVLASAVRNSSFSLTRRVTRWVLEYSDAS